MAAPVQAVIFVSETNAIDASARCMQHCQLNEYDVIGVVARDWDAVAQMLRDGRAGVLVIDSRTDLPVDAEPRMEVVAEVAPPTPRQRRTRIIRRTITRRGGGA